MILTVDQALMTRAVCRNKGILKASSVIRLCFADLAEPEYYQGKKAASAIRLCFADLGALK